MKTIAELWDYIVQHELLDSITEDSFWICRDGHMYVKYYDEDYDGELTLPPLEYLERTDEDIAAVTCDLLFPADDWNELNRACCSALAEHYREYLKNQLSYLQRMYYNG